MAAPIVLLCAALSGCVGIDSTSSDQPASSGPVTLTIHACAKGAPSCNAESNTGSVYGFLDSSDSDDQFPIQLIVSVRLPAGSTPPNTLIAPIDGGGTLTFKRETNLEADLQALEPAPAGEQWWGWLSNKVDYGRKTKQGFSVSIQTTLPDTGDGTPYPTPFKWSATVGGRTVEPSYPVTRAVDCGNTNNDLYGGWGEGGSGVRTICIDSPAPAATRGHLDAPIVDFGLTGTTVQTSPGGSVTATFLAKRTGEADPATTYSLAATGGVPGGTVMLDRSTAPLGGDSTIPVLATATAPAGAAPGSYTVTLTATAPAKPTKSTTSTVVVAAPSGGGGGGDGGAGGGGGGGDGGGQGGGGGGGATDTRKPTVRSAALAKKRFKAKKNATELRVDSDEMGKLEVVFDRLDKGRKKGSKCSKSAKKGKKCTVVTRVKGALTQALPAGLSRIGFDGKVGSKKLKPGSYQLTLTVTDSAGNRSAAKKLKFTVTR
jgi:hypothetical protein